MTQHQPADMASIGEIERLSAEIGARIVELREARQMEQAQLARAGDSVRQLVKLSAQRVTPNATLGFRETSEREALKGLIEAGLQSPGLSLEQARPLAELMLEVLDSPAIRERGIPTRDTARILAAHVIEQFFQQKRGC
jgi:hypothetical protein